MAAHSDRVVVKDYGYRGRGVAAAKVIEGGQPIVRVTETLLSAPFVASPEAHSRAKAELAYLLYQRRRANAAGGSFDWALHSAPHHRKLTPSPHSELTDAEWTEYLAQIETNVFEIPGEQSQLAILGACTLFNHSCSPNAAIYVFDGSNVLVVALENIELQTEITIAYAPFVFTLPPARRRLLLLAQFGFECQCGACMNDNRPYLTAATGKLSKAEVDKMAAEFQQYEAIATSPFTSEDLPKQIITACKQFEAWPLHENHWRQLAFRKWRIEAVIALLDAGMEKSPSRLKALLLKQFETEEAIFPANHSERLTMLQTYLACHLGPLPPKWDAELKRLKSIYTLNTEVPPF